MAGEIHGIISREQAWEMWRPYGDRVELDGSLDPGALTHEDALQVLFGADRDTAGMAYGRWYDETDDREWYAGVFDLDFKEEPELVELLVASNNRQQAHAERLRSNAIEGGLDFAFRLGRASSQLKDEGLFTPSQLDSITSWLIGPDGQPHIQYTPMSQLEYARLAREYDKEEACNNLTDCTDFYFGIIRSAVRFTGKPTVITQHNKVHELVHGSVSGVELYDITREDGLRLPTATVVGVFANEPTTKIEAGDNYSKVENVELNEGWTDYITRQLIRVDPALGKELGKAKGYAAWAKTIVDVRQATPDIYAAITEAMLVEASPEDPDVKRTALAEMHVYADRKLGVTNALNQLFVANGGSILDIYTKGK